MKYLLQEQWGYNFCSARIRQPLSQDPIHHITVQPHPEPPNPNGQVPPPGTTSFPLFTSASIQSNPFPIHLGGPSSSILYPSG